MPDDPVSAELRERLQRLEQLRAELSRFERTPAAQLETLVPGREMQTPLGPCYLFEERFDENHIHGSDALGALHGRALAPAVRFGEALALEGLQAKDCTFLDTETTGLSFGAGTLVFMVGIGWLDADTGSVTVRQYFLRDPAEEPAMLAALAESLRERPALVTFNGRGFDVPLLAGRFRLNRMPAALEAQPHLDLLPPARRLWRRRAGSCALGNLERVVLGVQRTGEDIPGWAIPQVYADYLRTGDARQINRVFYHNLADVLSMVTLLARVLAAWGAAADGTLPAQDRLSLARWHERLERPMEAERGYIDALYDAALPDADAREAFARLGVLLRRAERRAEAAGWWARWAARFPDDSEPRVELAKHHEWHDKDLAQAYAWALEALECADMAARAEIEHRLARLERKLRSQREKRDG